MRGGMIWLVLMIFWEPGAETVMVLLARVGVERLIEGRLKAAGSMSGMVELRGQPARRVQRETTAQRAKADGRRIEVMAEQRRSQFSQIIDRIRPFRRRNR